MPRLNVVNALLEEWRRTQVPLTRHRLLQADPVAKEDLELYLNYVEMLRTEAVEFEADIDALKVGPVPELSGQAPCDLSSDVSARDDLPFPRLIETVYPKDMLEREYGMKSVWSVPRLIARIRVPLPTIFKGNLSKEDASERLSWLNRMALEHPSKDACYLSALISGDIYNSIGDEYLITAEVFYGMAYSLASTATQRALSLSRMAIVMAKLKSEERKWFGRVLVVLAERLLDGSDFDDSRVTTHGEFINSVRSVTTHLVSLSPVSQSPDIIDRDVLGLRLPAVDFLDSRKIDQIDAGFSCVESFPPDTVKFYQKRFISSYLCFGSFFVEGLESGCGFAKAHARTLGVNPASFEFLLSNGLQHAPLLADDTSANELRKIKSKPSEPTETDNEEA